MNALLQDVQWPACLSAYRLDCFRLSALTAEEEAAVRAHLDGCTRCRTALEAQQKDAADFAASAPPLQKRPAPRRIGVWATAATALAATLLITLWPHAGVRRKGPPVSVGMYVQHGQAVRRALPGEVVAPGDALRFVYSSAEPAYLAILSVDGAGTASVYFPDGPLAVSMPMAEEAALPLGTQLDGVLGAEEVVALFCQQPLQLEPVRQALQATPSVLPQLPGCRLATFPFTKRTP
jgi:hypothetical protein